MEAQKSGSGYLKVYTRTPDKDSYPYGLAFGIHMACSEDGREFKPLNKNYGILFAEAVILRDDTLSPRGVRDPKVFALQDGGYGIAAVRVRENGEPDEGGAGKVLFWTTKDWIHFEAKGLVPVDETEGKAAAEGGRIRDCVEVDRAVLDRAAKYWNPVYHTETVVPECVRISSARELDDVMAEAVYSDGSRALKRVLWEKETIDFSRPGVCGIKGSVQSKKYAFPLAEGFGDPVIFRWEGKWYYTSTNDNLGDIGLYVREADTVEGLFAEGTEQHLILPLDEKRELIQTFWAPEFHVIGGNLYLLFAVSGHVWGPQCHLLKLKEGKPIVEAESWEDPVRVRRQDGSYLSEDGITLDMTYIKTKRQPYVVWSYRRHIFSPLDTGSMLCIATVDEREPWKLTSEPVLLSRPLFGWENVDNTINNEGPYAFVRDGMVYLTYSGGAANSYTYAVGLLTAREEDDLLDVSCWQKRCAPVLSFYSVEGEYGPGHNSFYEDEDGNLMIAYHGEKDPKQTLRCDGIRRVHFKKDGTPEFGMSAQEDFDPALGNVNMKIEIVSGSK